MKNLYDNMEEFLMDYPECKKYTIVSWQWSIDEAGMITNFGFIADKWIDFWSNQSKNCNIVICGFSNSKKEVYVSYNKFERKKHKMTLEAIEKELGFGIEIVDQSYFCGACKYYSHYYGECKITEVKKSRNSKCSCGKFCVNH